MKIVVIAKARARQEKVVEVGANTYEISVTEVPAKGKANDAIIKALANYLNVAPSRLCVLRGQTSRKKFIELT